MSYLDFQPQLVQRRSSEPERRTTPIFAVKAYEYRGPHPEFIGIIPIFTSLFLQIMRFFCIIKMCDIRKISVY
ncbi:hypothetical protein [Brucella suis]|uniref:hypothetical protein n=1 Tax=Brucella suis TaxID=29461 RepID=UPI0001BA0EB5|nr:hypothetical protein [Brucella suis]EEY27574.1 predicted protein [Brucella suis bv. 5 str. 513]